jgi:hypothetical protein
MSWEEEWRRIAPRIDAWNASVEYAMRLVVGEEQLREKTNRALAPEAQSILDEIEKLELPDWLAAEVKEIARRLGGLEDIVDGRRVINARGIVLAALRAPLDNAARSKEGPRRRLVDRAFLHLNRTLAVDADVRERWAKAFAVGETRCEQLGGLHLLSHGIYGFKADGGTGRTDLILGDRLMVNDETRAAEAMVLTEWKLAREGDDPAAKCVEGREQAEIYSVSELGGFELRRHRYVVVVSPGRETMLPSEVVGEVTYHYVNIAIDPDSPSDDSRRMSRKAAKR